jgi:hypothetical protein
LTSRLACRADVPTLLPLIAAAINELQKGLSAVVLAVSGRMRW